MALSEHERRIFDEMWADLPPLRVGIAFRLRLAATRAARRSGTWLQDAFPYLVVLLVGVGMVVLAGVLFHDGYAAGTAAVSAAATGFLLGAVHRDRAEAKLRSPRRVGKLSAERQANREQ